MLRLVAEAGITKFAVSPATTERSASREYFLNTKSDWNISCVLIFYRRCKDRTRGTDVVQVAPPLLTRGCMKPTGCRTHLWQRISPETLAFNAYGHFNTSTDVTVRRRCARGPNAFRGGNLLTA